MTKVLEKDGRTEMSISTEKEQGKRNSTDLFLKNGFSACKFVTSLWRSQTCLKILFFYLNQSYLSYEDNKKIYYTDIFLIEQIVPLLNQPENLDKYTPKENEVKILRAKYNTVTG